MADKPLRRRGGAQKVHRQRPDKETQPRVSRVEAAVGPAASSEPPSASADPNPPAPGGEASTRAVSVRGAIAGAVMPPTSASTSGGHATAATIRTSSSSDWRRAPRSGFEGMTLAEAWRPSLPRPLSGGPAGPARRVVLDPPPRPPACLAPNTDSGGRGKAPKSIASSKALPTRRARAPLRERGGTCAGEIRLHRVRCAARRSRTRAWCRGAPAGQEPAVWARSQVPDVATQSSPSPGSQARRCRCRRVVVVGCPRLCSPPVPGKPVRGAYVRAQR